MFMLESHLSSDQNRVLAEVQEAAAGANLSVFVTGGAMRDMLGGFPIGGLDFTVEGDAVKFASALASKTKAAVVEKDTVRNTAVLLFPGGVTAQIGMARREWYPKPGGKPQVTPVTIHEDLRHRDFTVNAIGLSLNRASRGLLIDPTNGLGDLERKELRTAYNYALYDDPTRIIRLVRLRARLGFAVEEKTQLQYQNARAEGLVAKIPPRRLFDELRHIAEDPNAVEVIRALDQEGLMQAFSPALTGPKLNLPGLAKLQKARQAIQPGVNLPADNVALLMFFLAEKLTPKERAALAKHLSMHKAEIEAWQKLEQRARKLERDLKSPKLNRPSAVYAAASKAPGEAVIFLLAYSQVRVVQDRVRNYVSKYLPVAQEVTDEQVAATGAKPGTPKFEKTRADLIATRLNARPKKPAPEAEKPAEEPEAPAGPAPLRRPYTRQPSAR